METTVYKPSTFHIKETIKEWIAYGICLLCLVLFVTSAYDKIIEHSTFAIGLSNVAFIGKAAPFVSWLVPTAEILISLLLIIPSKQRLGLYFFVGLMTIFTIYISSMWLWAEKLPCHCNLIIDKLSWGQHIWINLGFISLAICALYLSNTKQKFKS